MTNHYTSAHELAQALYRGQETDFEYWCWKIPTSEQFRIVKREPVNWFTIERLSTGKTAKAHGLYNLTDFQGIAACLIAEPEFNLLFDKQGNIIKRIP